MTHRPSNIPQAVPQPVATGLTRAAIFLVVTVNPGAGHRAEIRAGERHAVSTPGDMLFHIRAQRMDLCFELETQIMARLGTAISPVDEVQGFRYFDSRDLIGFVDGTENPRGEDAVDATLI